MKKNLLLILSLIACAAKAQDIHFSQFYNAPQNLNPSLAGVFDGDYRIAANHKNQWRTIPVPYRTYSVSFDAKLPLGLKRDFICAGILLNNDKSGDGAFISNQVGLTLSYLKKLNADSTSFLSIGIQPSFNSKGFDLKEVTTVFSNDFDYGYGGYGLELDKEYFVMGLVIYQKSNCLYYLIDVNGKPDWFPYLLFAMLNFNICFCTISMSASSLAFGPF